MAPKIINKGRAFIQHGDNVITIPFLMSTSNFLSILSLHLPRLFDMDVTTRGPGHSPGAFPAGIQTASGNMTITIRPDFNTVTGTNTRLKVRLHGGYGYTSGGQIAGPANTGQTERYDDIANSQVVRANLLTFRQGLVGFSLNGFGYTVGGTTTTLVSGGTGNTERFDEVINSNIQRTSRTPLTFHASFDINGFGFGSGGTTIGGVVSPIVEKFDDVTNSWETRTPLSTARSLVAGFGLNNFGFTFGGTDGISSQVGTIERFDDNTNTQILRNPNDLRRFPACFSLNGFGFMNRGSSLPGPALFGTTNKFDDVANTNVGRTSSGTSRDELAGYSLNGFGFTSCGDTSGGGAITGLTERLDDVANSQTTVTAATSRSRLAGFSTNEYFVNFRTYNE